MGQIKSPEPVLLFVGTLYSDPAIFDRAKEILEKTFGDSVLVGAALDWKYSPYYKDELGWPIKRRFIFFRNLIDPGMLADIKVRTNGIEDSFAVDNKRRINLDPGYLTLAKIVLASTKNYSHRIYLGRGIYGEVTLFHKDGTYRPHLFTYRDFQEQECIDILLSAREILKKILLRPSQ